MAENPAGKSTSFFDDEDFQDHLIALLVRDVAALRTVAHLLRSEDFKPLRGMVYGRARWIVAQRALEYYTKYHEPIGRLLRADMLEYSEVIGLSARQLGEIQEYLVHLNRIHPTGPDAITSKVLRYKRQKLKAEVLQEMAELHAIGKLTDEKWHELTSKVTGSSEGEFLVTDYFDGMEDRLERRAIRRGEVYFPALFIDPLDAMVRSIGAGQLGLVLAPTARGKSLFLLWVAVAYTLQRLNVFFCTLEDQQQEVEDRLDAAVTAIPMSELSSSPKTMKQRFLRFRRHIRSHLKIIDGTQGGLTVPIIEKLLLRERDRGFYADAVIIDYDDEIAPTVRQKERRLELSDIYRDLRRLAARGKQIVWTAAQTQRNTEGRKILSGDLVAEDIGKVRKATMAVSLGQGEWGDDSIYIWVAKHKFDRQHVGCHIIPDRSRMLIYDRERTRQAALEHMEEEEKEA